MPKLLTNHTRTYYPGMDNLRGIAILLVILYHDFPDVSLTEFGFLGVDLFFVISGFLITDILLQQKQKRSFFRNFYAKRILRIFPIYYATLLFLIFILPLFLNVPYNLQYYLGNQAWFYFFLQNWLFVLKPLENKFLLNHFWSLAIEEQFYIIWPVIIFYTAKINRLLYAIIGLFITIFAIRFILLYTNLLAHYTPVFTFFRFDGLLTGCALAIFFNQGFIANRKIWGAIFIPIAILNAGFFIAVYVFSKNLSYFPYCGFTTFSALFGLVAWQAIKKNNAIKNNTTFRVLRYFGKISYGLYIYHWPIFVLLYPVIQTALRHCQTFSPFAINICAGIICAVSAVLLSIISRKYPEQFFLNLKKKFVLQQ